ncbi:MAG TPA: hypothetical protein VM939_11475 [Gemmatimonadaceae bacterium]|nr:hypothetical protein [Gemmatimonadaceae bacterium]
MHTPVAGASKLEPLVTGHMRPFRLASGATSWRWFLRLAGRPETVDQAMQHFLHFYRLADRGVAPTSRNDPHAPCDQIVIFKLRGGSESVTEKPRESAFGLLLSTLGDIRWN